MMKTIPITTVSAVIDILGGAKSVAKLTRTTSPAVYNWRTAKVFPANTYLILTHALLNRGYVAENRLWAMRLPAGKAKQRTRK